MINKDTYEKWSVPTLYLTVDNKVSGVITIRVNKKRNILFLILYLVVKYSYPLAINIEVVNVPAYKNIDCVNVRAPYLTILNNSSSFVI